MRKRTSLLLSLLCLLLYINPLQAQFIVNPTSHCTTNCNFTHLSADTETTSFLKDENTLWIGTNGGLIQYDQTTHTYQKYTTRDGLPSNAITALVKGKDEVLWVGTEQGLVKLQDDCFYYDETRKFDNPYLVHVTHLEMDALNRLWVTQAGSSYHTIVYDPATKEAFTLFSNYTDEEWIRPDDMVNGTNQEMWILMSVGGQAQTKQLARYDLVTEQLEIKKTGLPANYQSDEIMLDKNGDVWFSTNHQIYQYLVGSDELILRTDLTNNWVGKFALLENESGRINPYFNQRNWNIIYQNNEETIRYELGEHHFFYINNIQTIDNELWLATNEGILKQSTNDPSGFEKQTPALKAEITKTTISALAADEQGNMWIGHRGRGYGLTKYQTDGTYQIIEDVDYDIYEIFIHDNEIWTISYQALYHSTNQETFERVEITIPDEVAHLTSSYFPSNMVRHLGATYMIVALFAQEEEAKYIASYQNGSMHLETRLPDSARKIASDGNETLYITTDEAVLSYKNGNLETLIPNAPYAYILYHPTEERLYLTGRNTPLATYKSTEGLLEHPNQKYDGGEMVFDQNGTVWISGWGIANSQGIGPLFIKDGLPDNYIQSIATDANNNIWVGTNNGIAIYQQSRRIDMQTTAICINDEVTININTQDISNVEWTIYNYSRYEIVTGTSNVINYTFNHPSTHFIELTYQDNNGCQRTETRSVNVKSYTQDVNIQESFPLCDITSGVTVYAPTQMKTYEWRFNDEVIAHTPSFIAKQQGTYEVYVTDHCGGERLFTTQVEAALAFELYSYYNTITKEYNINSSVPDGATYQWSNGTTNHVLQVTEPGTYSVTITFNGCTATNTIVVEPYINTSLAEDFKAYFSLLPNPATHQTWIHQSVPQELQITLYTLTGQQVIAPIQSDALKTAIPLQNIPKGMYIVQVQTKEGVYTQKLLKN